MTSDRMMQALGRIERAISRLESDLGRMQQRLRDSEAEAAAQAAARALAEERARDDAERPEAAPEPPDPHAMDPFSRDKALAALRSLDSLIEDLQKARRDG